MTLSFYGGACWFSPLQRFFKSDKNVILKGYEAIKFFSVTKSSGLHSKVKFLLNKKLKIFSPEVAIAKINKVFGYVSSIFKHFFHIFFSRKNLCSSPTGEFIHCNFVLYY